MHVISFFFCVAFAFLVLAVIEILFVREWAENVYKANEDDKDDNSDEGTDEAPATLKLYFYLNEEALN